MAKNEIMKQRLRTAAESFAEALRRGETDDLSSLEGPVMIIFGEDSVTVQTGEDAMILENLLAEYAEAVKRAEASLANLEEETHTGAALADAKAALGKVEQERDEAREKLFDRTMAAKKSGYEDGKREAERERDELKGTLDCQYRFSAQQRELRKKAEQERDEARVKLCNFKENKHIYAAETDCEAYWCDRAYQAEAAQVGLVDALKDASKDVNDWCIHLVDLPSLDRRAKALRKALANLDPSVERIQKIVKAAEEETAAEDAVQSQNAAIASILWEDRIVDDYNKLSRCVEALGEAQKARRKAVRAKGETDG